MASPGFESKVTAIVEAVRERRAAEGRTSLLLTNKIPGLGMAYGTKLLYFAGHRSDSPGFAHSCPVSSFELRWCTSGHRSQPRARSGVVTT